MVMKRGLPGENNTWVLIGTNHQGGPHTMLHLGLDLSRKRLDVCVLDERGERIAVTAAPPDADGLHELVKRLATYGGPVHAVIESMTGARFVHVSMNRETMRRRGFVPYGPSRAGAEALSLIMTEDLRPYGIAVNI